MMKPRSYFREKVNGSDRAVLPLYHHIGEASSQTALSGRSLSCIHIIPLVLLLCFFVLWWFSYPLNLEIKDGRITLVRHSDIEMPKFIKETRVDFAFLATIGTPPYTSLSEAQPEEDNQNTAEPGTRNGTD